MDWATSSVMISLFEPVLHHSDRKKKTQKSPNTEKPDVTSTAMLGTIKPDGMIKYRNRSLHSNLEVKHTHALSVQKI